MLRFHLSSLLLLSIGIVGCAPGGAGHVDETRRARSSLVKASAAAPFIGPAVALTDPVYAPVGGKYSGPAVATNGSSYMIVVARPTPGASLEAAPVTPDGEVQLIPTTIDEQYCYHASLFWTGTEYLFLCQNEEGFHAYRVDTEGVAGVGQLVLPLADGYVAGLQVAKGGDHYLYAWEDESVIWGLLFRDDGNDVVPVAEQPFVIGEGPRNREDPRVAWLGDSFYVAYMDDRYVDVRSFDVRGTLVGIDGTVQNTDGDEVRAHPTEYEVPFALVEGDVGALLVYRQYPSARVVTIRPDGSVDDASTRELGEAGSYPQDYAWTGTWTGQGWQVKGPEPNENYTVPAQAALPATAYPHTLPGPQGSAFAWAGDRGLLVSRSGSLQKSMLLSRDAPVGPAMDVRRAGKPFEPGAVGSDGVGFLVAYGVLSDAYALALDVHGAHLGGSWENSVNRLDRIMLRPRVSSSLANRYLLSEVSPGGVCSCARWWVLDRAANELDHLGGPPLGAFGYAMGSTELGHLFVLDGPQAARVEPEGRLIDDRLWRVNASHSNGRDVSVAGSGDRYLIAFTRDGFDGGAAGLFGSRVAHEDAQVLDRTALTIESDDASPHDPVVVGCEDHWIVVWQNDWSLRYARISLDGELITQPANITTTKPPIPIASTSDQLVAGACGGNYALLTWAHAPEPDGPREIVRAIVGPDIDGPITAQTLVTGEHVTEHLGVASAGGDQFVVVYGRYEPELAAPRLYSRVVALDTPLGTACSTDQDCGANPCVDGVCCNRACGNGAPDDCQACAESAGGSVDGACGPVSAGLTCRVAAGACDVAEVCDGIGAECPSDASMQDGADCDDGDLCNGVATCMGGTCVNAPALDCEDGSSCTIDTCDASAGCVYAQVECETDDPCMVGSCENEVGCVFSERVCVAPDACSVATCDPFLGCVNSPIVCDDADPCTFDGCRAMDGCTFEPKPCLDSDPCTADACDSETGQCTHTPVNCDDGNVCTTEECDSLEGCVSAPVDCDDGDACTVDSCDPATGCAHQAIDCDDGDACTIDDCDRSTGCRSIEDTSCEPDQPDPQDPLPDQSGSSSGCSVGTHNQSSLPSLIFFAAIFALRRRRQG